jgi:major membrane immunogen (membrane-anchored lipoprotein)
MGKNLIAIVMVSITVACLISGCTTDASIDTDTKPDSSTALPPEQKITATGVHINWGEDISFEGQSTLPDGTYLQTQLFEDDEPAAWWPTDRHIQVQDGEWQITVSLTGLSEDVTKLHTGSEAEFLFKVWEKDEPTVVGFEYFDLMGPPSAIP